MQDYSAGATVMQDEHSDYSADKGSCNLIGSCNIVQTQGSCDFNLISTGKDIFFFPANFKNM